MKTIEKQISLVHREFNQQTKSNGNKLNQMALFLIIFWQFSVWILVHTLAAQIKKNENYGFTYFIFLLSSIFIYAYVFKSIIFIIVIGIVFYSDQKSISISFFSFVMYLPIHGDIHGKFVSEKDTKIKTVNII